MKTGQTPRLVLVTASSLDEARRIAEALLKPRLAACVNLVPAVESHYWWRGKLERASEILLLVKTSAEKFEAVAAAVKANHSYQCPEILALDPREMTSSYRAWWEGEMTQKIRLLPTRSKRKPAGAAQS